ncbi:VKOR-domain-containing protein [Scenedesmus sp. NREL 46B-D3]|nr:VKOR-domain-containing protein [Scenedesmus sp. NREL 46B-D3]
MAALASVGAAETLYLTATKLLNASVACPTSGCDAVLSSPYSQLFGVPLPLLGAAAYTAVALAAGGAASLTRSGRAVPSWLSSGLAADAAGRGLMCVVLDISCRQRGAVQQPGGWYGTGGRWQMQQGQAWEPPLQRWPCCMLALARLPGTGISNAAELELPYISPQVTTESSQQTLSLAHRLREAGAVMYGAFWCSHCYDQKQEFGAAAMAEFPYVECFPQGWKKAFPTWIINGNTTEGQVELAQLEQMMADAQGQGAAAQDSAVAAVTGQ